MKYIKNMNGEKCAKIIYFQELILNLFQLLSLLKPILVLSYFNNLKSHLQIERQAVIKQCCVLLRYMTYFTFVTVMYRGVGTAL